MPSTHKQEIRFGVIGCGLMGREFASAAARWMHLLDLDFRPTIVAACDTSLAAAQWFEQHIPSVRSVTADYRDLLADDTIDAIYCAVPHSLHAQLYVDIIAAGKHLLGEKPFGVDRVANEAINAAIDSHPDVLVRCSSEFPFFPGAYQIARWVAEDRFGKIIEAEVGFWHSSDLDPHKAINWKRMIDINGAYGCMGDLGMHVLHLPLRFGWKPMNVRALLSNIITERPDNNGRMVPCETWDNAILATQAAAGDLVFPLLISTKRIAPGHANTWFIKIYGTEFSAEWSTKNPKRLRFMPYRSGEPQIWHTMDTPYASAYPSITGSIFEFGFSDAILQMWAAFCDELTHGTQMRQPLHCATPQEAAQTHIIFTAALQSQAAGQTVPMVWQSGAYHG